jgi:hypothetical protein
MVLLCLFQAGASARTGISFNLNIDNGLPTNYAYCTIVDRYGYLWIATAKGVVRYNGYESRVYNYNHGLPEDDIWRLYEDKKGRIWLSSISRQIGYIYNSEFHNVVNISRKTLYPKEILEYDSGIFFICPFFDNRGSKAIFIEKNDTLYWKLIPSQYDFVGKNGRALIVLDSTSIFRLYPDLNISESTSCKKNEFVMRYRDEFLTRYRNSASIDLKLSGLRWLLGNHILIYERNTDNILNADISNRNRSVIDFKKETGTRDNVQLIIRYNDGYYGKPVQIVISDSNIFEIDTALRFTRIGAPNAIAGKKANGKNLSYFMQDSLWNQCIATINQGVFINYQAPGAFRRFTAYQLDGYKYIGEDEGTCYWWENERKILAVIDRNRNIRYKKCSDLIQLEHIVRYSKDSLLLASRMAVSWLNNKTLAVTDFLSGFKKVRGDAQHSVIHGLTAYNLALVNRHRLYLLSRTRGLYDLSFNKDSLFLSLINRDRFDNLLFDSLRQDVWLYNHDDIEVYRNNVRTKAYDIDSLKALGIKNIESIIIDKYGNIFLKEYNRLLLFHNDIHQYTTLFNNYMLNGAIVSLYKDKLIVAGRFGLLFSKIAGASHMLQGPVHANTKNIFYNYVTDMQVSGNSVLLKTDKGLYTVDIPSDTAFHEQWVSPSTPYRLLLYYHRGLAAIRPNDTIAIYQNDPKLQFDVINPNGNGKAKCQYKISGIDSEWHESDNNYLVLPRLSPGRHYTISVGINDDAWKSTPLNLDLYVVPYWWQQPLWQEIFWISGVILVMLFGYVVALITRKIVTKKNARRNLQLALELKAIYSQINPHFIYNTLNSALLLIHNKKTDEAYRHITKFSRLLRAYVKSSRNKYISIGEEVVNLKNYIELQQTRFRNKFNYELITDEGMEALKIPSLLLQPFVENAINHGLIPKETTGNLTIRFMLLSSENELICIIEDDGVGRSISRSLKADTTVGKESYGDELIKDLVNAFNKYERINIEIKYVDKTPPDTGTIVEIRIKNIKQ